MSTPELALLSTTRSFNGWVKRYRHYSPVLRCEMVFSLYLPPAAERQPVPLLWWLSGLGCTDENFMQKAGAQRTAAAQALAIVCPDTSPRNTNLPGEHGRDDIGAGASFYLNATRMPWREHYQMYDYLIRELPALLHEHFPLNGREAISGHSMGGHGALLCALKNPGRYCSVSALAPICHPCRSGWGTSAFHAYLGNNHEQWKAWDACELVRAHGSEQALLVDQGDADPFYAQGQLHPETLKAACEQANVPLTLRLQPGYDHSYYFIASFIEDHVKYHAFHLNHRDTRAP